jgi:hypothetical protein
MPRDTTLCKACARRAYLRAYRRRYYSEVIKTCIVRLEDHRRQCRESAQRGRDLKKPSRDFGRVLDRAGVAMAAVLTAAGWLTGRAPRCLLCVGAGRRLWDACDVCNPPPVDRYQWVLSWDVESLLRQHGRDGYGRPYTPDELQTLRKQGWIIPPTVTGT